MWAVISDYGLNLQNYTYVASINYTGASIVDLEKHLVIWSTIVRFKWSAKKSTVKCSLCNILVMFHKLQDQPWYHWPDNRPLQSLSRCLADRPFLYQM